MAQKKLEKVENGTAPEKPENTGSETAPEKEPTETNEASTEQPQKKEYKAALETTENKTLSKEPQNEENKFAPETATTEQVTTLAADQGRAGKCETAFPKGHKSAHDSKPRPIIVFINYISYTPADSSVTHRTNFLINGIDGRFQDPYGNRVRNRFYPNRNYGPRPTAPINDGGLHGNYNLNELNVHRKPVTIVPIYDNFGRIIGSRYIVYMTVPP